MLPSPPRPPALRARPLSHPHGNASPARGRASGLLSLAAGLVIVLASSGCAASHQTPPSSAPVNPGHTNPGHTAATALAQLSTLSIKPPASMKKYDREADFGPAWEDVDDNGCDTRDDILRRDLTDVTFTPGTHRCQVATGTLHDPYTGKTIHFVRGRGTSAKVQIDHVVALGDAWRTGAQALSAHQREQLANDPRNLLAVDGPTNESKSDQDASQWLPPNRAFDCTYAADQIKVKVTYQLWVTRAEHDALAATLSSCSTPPAAAPAPGSRTPHPSATATATQDGDLPVVHPGAYCSPEGARGVTSAGTIMTCSSTDGGRPRWRSAT